jgi:hypothetical protein
MQFGECIGCDLNLKIGARFPNMIRLVCGETVFFLAECIQTYSYKTRNKITKGGDIDSNAI